MFTSGKRLMLTADDQVVEEGDPAAVKLLVAEGGQLSDEDAEKYGLSSGKKSEEEDDPNRPKEIKLGEAGTAAALREEEQINLGRGEDESASEGDSSAKAAPSDDAPKTSKKASRAAKKGK